MRGRQRRKAGEALKRLLVGHKSHLDDQRAPISTTSAASHANSSIGRSKSKETNKLVTDRDQQNVRSWKEDKSDVPTEGTLGQETMKKLSRRGTTCTSRSGLHTSFFALLLALKVLAEAGRPRAGGGHASLACDKVVSSCSGHTCLTRSDAGSMRVVMAGRRSSRGATGGQEFRRMWHSP
eukprot:753537-Hanusia_phi.AAC.4